MSKDRSSIAPLQISDFRRLWIASLSLNLGSLVQTVTAAWVVLEQTGSPAWVSLMLSAPLLPLLFLSLPAGAAADLLDRRWLLIASSTIMAAATAGMAVVWLAGVASPGLLVTLGLLVGTGNALFNPAWQAIVPTLVPAEVLPDAVALNSASGGVATAFGPALAGLLVATAGPGWAFVSAVLGYVPIVYVLLISKVPGWDRGAGSLGIAITTGLRYLRFSHGYRWLLLIGGLFGFTSAALQAMLPNITYDVLHGGSALYGVLLGAFGIGAFVGGVTRTQGARLLSRRMLPFSVLVYGGGGIVAALSRETPLTAAGVLLAGIMWIWILSTLNSTFQALTPDWVRGRTMGAYILAVFGFKPIGSVASGALGNRIGAAQSLLVFSILVIALAIFMYRVPFPVLEHVEPPVVLEPEADEDAGEVTTRPAPIMVVTKWQIEETETTAFLEVLTHLRRLRLSTGAYQWAAYRSATNQHNISEVYMLHSWDQYLQHTRRLDTRGHEIIREAERFGHPETHIKECLIAFNPIPDRKPERPHP